ncbi:MAG: toll/interleukin-1 receptor domain-containing protein [Kiritimatiellae bacterium]|nr:toll/interleukin-1 receptor domain-containing protein [Kiritimatiellia bacterium]MDX9794559.1 toll/interleukin-1 receptor domain-containing protein [Kiritimatiellia bacterium]
MSSHKKTTDKQVPSDKNGVDFFISYNSTDTLWVNGLSGWLNDLGLTSVSQSQDFVAGSNFVSEMNAAFERSRRVIAIASPAYFSAKFPASEWTAAFARDPTGESRTLILVRVRDCEIPELLKPLVYIDLCSLNATQARERSEHITDRQATQIKDMVDKLAEIDVLAGKPDSHGEWYARLYRKFPCRNSYHLIHIEDFPQVMTYLRIEAAKSRPKLRRTNNDAWRKRYTAAIWAHTKGIGLSHDAVHQLATERLNLAKPIRSLNDLGEQNLEKFYRMVMKL